LGVTFEDVRARVEETIGISGSAPTGSPPFTPRAKKVMELSFREALRLGHNYIGTEHLLLGVVVEGEGVGAQVLRTLGVEMPDVRQEITGLLGPQPKGGRRRSARAGIRPMPPVRSEKAVSAIETRKEWTARVVRAGRTPADYRAAYDELEDMFEGMGFELNDRDLGVSSVDTNEGPGIALSMIHRDGDPPSGTQSDEHGD